MPDLFSIARTNRNSTPAPLPKAPPVPLSREQIVDQIIAVNPSATAEFLDQFEDSLLNKYLEHLQFTQQPRCGKSSWDRPGDAPAIMVRRRVV